LEKILSCSGRPSGEKQKKEKEKKAKILFFSLYKQKRIKNVKIENLKLV